MGQVLTVDPAGQIRRELQPLEALVLVWETQGVSGKRMEGEVAFFFWVMMWDTMVDYGHGSMINQ